MNKQKKNEGSVPPSIELLFNNSKLDFMKTLCLLYAFSLESKKQRKISEVMFYYSLNNFGLIEKFRTTNNGDVNISTYSSNKHLRFEKKFTKILLNMSHLEFIVIKGNIVDKFENVTVKLTQSGVIFFEENNFDFFEILKKKYVDLFNEVKFSAENMKVMKGVEL